MGQPNWRKLITKGAKKWNDERRKHPEVEHPEIDEMQQPIKLKIANPDLRQVNLEGASLRYVEFDGVNLADARLNRAKLEWCRFSKGNLNGASLNQAMLDHCEFSWVDMKTVDLRASLVDGCTFERCDLSNAVFSIARTNHTDLRHCKLSGARFTNCDGVGLSFSGSYLKGVIFDETTFRSMWHRWRLAYRIVNFGVDGIVLSGADLRDANLTGVSFVGADLSNVDLTSTIYPGGTVLDGANFTNAILQGARILPLSAQNAVFAGVDLRRTPISGNFRGADLRGVNLSGVKFSPYNRPSHGHYVYNSYYDPDRGRSVFEQGWDGDPGGPEASLYLHDANLEGADLRGADLTWVSGLNIKGTLIDERTKLPDSRN